MWILKQKLGIIRINESYKNVMEKLISFNSVFHTKSATNIDFAIKLISANSRQLRKWKYKKHEKHYFVTIMFISCFEGKIKDDLCIIV